MAQFGISVENDNKPAEYIASIMKNINCGEHVYKLFWCDDVDTLGDTKETDDLTTAINP